MPRDPFRPPPRPQFGTQPVWRRAAGQPAKPLWGMRGGVMVPLFAADPCDPTCCESSGCEGCADSFRAVDVAIEGLLSGALEGSECGCLYGNLNGSYTLTRCEGTVATGAGVFSANFAFSFSADIDACTSLGSSTCGDRGLLVFRCTYSDGSQSSRYATHMTVNITCSTTSGVTTISSDGLVVYYQSVFIDNLGGCTATPDSYTIWQVTSPGMSLSGCAVNGTDLATGRHECVPVGGEGAPEPTAEISVAA